MYNINEILVCLDLSEIDKSVIHYTSFINSVISPRNIYFIYVDKESDNNKDLAEEERKKSKLQIEKSIKSEFKTAGKAQIHIEIKDGSPIHEVLNFAKDKDIEMIIVGKKKAEHGSGILSEKIARKSPCSVLFIPEQPPLKLEEILVPTDFSEYSKLAFEEVRVFIRKIDYSLTVFALHIYDVPIGFYTTGKSYEEFANIMKDNAKKDYKRFLHEINCEDLKIKPFFVLDEDRKSNASQIMEFAIRKKCDLIIIGAKGHSNASAMLLGSTTEKLLRQNDSIPLMVLKKKGETLNFLEALLKL